MCVPSGDVRQVCVHSSLLSVLLVKYNLFLLYKLSLQPFCFSITDFVLALAATATLYSHGSES